jgi:hypothetical protein
MRRAARKRTTRQLEQVFKALQGDHTHPFAHEIYQRVHKKLPRISLALHSADRGGNSPEFSSTRGQVSSVSASMSLTVSFSQVRSSRRSER